MNDGGRFALVRTTLLDYPGKVAATVFLPGCNLRCPYCHNPDLVLPDRIKSSPNLNADIPLLEAFLKKRSKVLGGLAISGGEALLSPLLQDILGLAVRFELPVKLDTAGLLPNRLEEVLKHSACPIRYVAVDLKTTLDRYGELGWKYDGGDVTGPYMESLSLLDEYCIDYELRTTVIQPFVDALVLRKLVSIAESAPRWIWQAYHPGDTLNPEWCDMETPDEYKLKRLAIELGLDSRVSVR